MTTPAPDVRRSWLIHASSTKGEERYARNICVSVFAPDIYTALALFKEAYPTANVWTISHEGKRLVLGDSAGIDH